MIQKIKKCYPNKISEIIEVGKNIIQKCEEAAITIYDESKKHFKKCKFGRLTTIAADDILFNTELMYPDGFPDLRKDINGYTILFKPKISER